MLLYKSVIVVAIVAVGFHFAYMEMLKLLALGSNDWGLIFLKIASSPQLESAQHVGSGTIPLPRAPPRPGPGPGPRPPAGAAAAGPWRPRQIKSIRHYLFRRQACAPPAQPHERGTSRTGGRGRWSAVGVVAVGAPKLGQRRLGASRSQVENLEFELWVLAQLVHSLLDAVHGRGPPAAE